MSARAQARHQSVRAAELQRELRDLLCLAVVGDHIRWVLTDDGGELAEWLAEAVPQWRGLADEVAKRLVALGFAPDGRVRSLARDIPLNWVPEGWLSAAEAERLLADRLHAVALWARVRRSRATDPDTAQLLETVSTGLERVRCARGSTTSTPPVERERPPCLS